MRIGVEVRSLKGTGGLRRYCRVLAEALSRHAGEHTFIFYGDPETNFPLPTSARFQFRNVGFTTNRILWEQLCLARAAREDRVDLLHCTDATAPLNASMPLVVTVHDMIYLRYPETQSLKARVIYHGFARASARRATRIVADSEYTRRELLAAIPDTAPSQVALLPVDESFFRGITDDQMNTVRAKYRLPERFLFFVGTLEKRKNLAGLFRAFGQLKRAGEFDGSIVIGGHSPASLRDLPLIRSLGIESDVMFTGVVEGSDLPALYRLAAVFVFPSLYEGFGWPPLEAMACGTPVVASNATCIPEICGEAALLFDPQSPDELASCVRRVLSDASIRADLSARGMKRVQQFTMDSFERRMLEVYESVMGKS